MNRIVRASTPPLRCWHHTLRVTCPGVGLRGLDRVLADTVYGHVAQARKRTISGTAAVAGPERRTVLAPNIRATVKPKLYRSVPLGTLDPRRLYSKDFLVLSGLSSKHPRVIAADDIPGVDLSYCRQGRTRLAFPSGTQGFLYWHLEADAPALAGQVRFRITTSSDPATFPEGHDLQLPDGRTWNISIFRIARMSSYAGLRAQLLSDKLVTVQLLDTALTVSGSNGVKIEHPSSSSTFVWKFRQTFAVELESTSIRIWLLGSSGGQLLRLEYLFSLKEATGTTRLCHAPFIGKALVQFERSTLPEHKGTRTVVLRVSKIIELTKTGSTGPVKWVPEPEEGGLVMMRKVNGEWIPWSVNVDKPWSEYHIKGSTSLAVLFEHDDQQAGGGTKIRGNEPDRLHIKRIVSSR
ncbi:hypothetical protein OE88DRAFT_1667622 [Heliocybe sulcata]|uniref:Uncharacterized protein n=1 Tax=Heliocybe sulcata TaxID=5364 RepID=A0A5C3MYK1_9AGAM|nr:hypothetical protein OE88DRAFT_1667622 [Heliocybe sulcata]